MNEKLRWQKALFFSVFFHVMCLVSIGFASLLYPESPSEDSSENIVEMSLVEMDVLQPATAGDTDRSKPDKTVTGDFVMPRGATAVMQEKNAVSEPVLATVASEVEMAEAIPAVATKASQNVGVQGQAESVDSANLGGGGDSTVNSGGFSPPSVLSRVQPEYPVLARQSGIEGRVVLKVMVMENGRVGEITVESSSGNSALDQAAEEAIWQWQFIPAKNKGSGDAVVCYCKVPVDFRLRSN